MLKIQVISGHIYLNENIFKSLGPPFIQFTVDGIKYKTKKFTGGGFHPMWNSEMV